MKHNCYTKRDAIKNYFPLPNEIFCLNLSCGEIAVYAYLLYRENRKTFQCHPSFRSIGNALNVSRNTVRKYIKGLEAKQLIRTEPTTVTLKSGKKQNGNLLYTIRPIQDAVNCSHAKQLKKANEEYTRWQAQKRLEEYDRKHGVSGTSRSSLFEAG